MLFPIKETCYIQSRHLNPAVKFHLSNEFSIKERLGLLVVQILIHMHVITIYIVSGNFIHSTKPNTAKIFA